MNRAYWPLTLLLAAAVPSLCSSQQQQAPAPGPAVWSEWRTPQVSPALLDNSFPKNDEKGNGKENGNGNGKGNGKENGDSGPKHIRDNGFLIEEAFNQEKGDVQHIFNWVNFWDRNGQGRSRSFFATFTMELPLGSQTHQFSFSTQFLTSYERRQGGPAMQLGDIGDTNLNYRYQLLADDDFLWMAPRFTLVLPTGDERFGFGLGKVGYQFNLPVSKYTDSWDYHFNAGFTFTPNVSSFLENGIRSPKQDLRAYNLGGTVLWKPRVDLHFFTELLALRSDGINDRGLREATTQVFLNPGFRYAVIQDPVEWVLGVAVPVGLNRDTPDIGVFAYMSVEHTFRKEKKNGNGNGNGNGKSNSNGN